MAPTAPVPTQGITSPKRAADSPSDGSKSNAASGNKRITTPHACAECKRRKIRCDGQQPCGQCLSSRAPKRCFYDKHRQRVIPSRKALETLSKQLEECRSVLNRLYPHQDISSISSLSRQELLNLLDRPNTPESLPSPPLNVTPLKQDMGRCHESDDGLASIDHVPSQSSEWGEERGARDAHSASEAEDLDALGFNPDCQPLHLGASSIQAALMVMLKAQPNLKNSLIPPLNSVEMANNLPVIRQRPMAPKETPRIPWSWKGQTLIDAYFKRVHVFIPMLDEAGFRSDYLEGQRSDPPWLALLNIVFAMGSITSMKSDDFTHINYYNHAMEHITIDSFGSGNIETIQALIIIGGYYLHYINRPNMANAVMGAAIRMASSHGLHREAVLPGGNDIAAADTRRRTWWSLVCLDTWTTSTMGRPSFGRFGPANNIAPPEIGMNQMRECAQHAGILPLIENIKFCKVATRIQDLLAVTPLVRGEDRRSMDCQLVSWYDNLPWLLRTMDPCAEPLYIARCIMKWRYQNLRMLLHRPVLLAMASSTAGTLPAEQDISSVEICREMAKATIEDISREWTQNQMAGWNAVWFLYQAAMIPLISMFWEWDSSLVPEWQNQVETILKLFEAMEDWSLAARRSREVVWRMYEASRQTVAAGPDKSLQLVTENGMMVGQTEFQLSPVGPESEDMMGMLQDQGLLDLEGSFWGPHVDSVHAGGTMCDVDEGMMAMDYGTMGDPGNVIDPSFFVP